MEFTYLIGLIVLIAVICALLPIPEKFQQLLYVICAVLVIVAVAGYFFGFSGGHALIR